ncbi:pilus assembly protein TadG-related protein [Cryobacterium sp. SO2]|uniref:pilus assembly protein TadG-related protein n=1 Tax=Cryobacterium sp. SO2 TaxID=1897060 RepID=UPI00223D7347|nr:pilus assembly protein TadG-related protein [Cryobacterium sp. SO2]WEO78006.1 pilus assembly protein TadG-related protein [Cryobacterium sp. SO2]
MSDALRVSVRRLAAALRNEEHGAVAVIVAVSMVVLLGFTALAIDTGALYAERAQLQNGADAAALAVAQDCAKGACGNIQATAQSFANASANDGAAAVSVTAPSTAAPTTVRVQTSTKDGATGAGTLALSFAPVLGIDSKAVAASATASWGSPASGPAMLPLAFAECAFARTGVQVITTGGTTGSSATCPLVNGSGTPLPGGFGWLDDPTGTCRATVNIATSAAMSSDTGANLPTGCAAVLTAALGKTVLLPVFSSATGSGSGGSYTIRGWAAFKLLGWRFPSSSYNNNTYTGARCTGSCKGVIGEFVSFVSLDDRFTTGGPNLGASIVTLTR